jgi:hypothetical protein
LPLVAGTGDESSPDSPDGTSEAPSSTPSGWPLLRSVLRRQRRGLMLGSLIGLCWSASKVAVPRLTRQAVDRGGA